MIPQQQLFFGNHSQQTVDWQPVTSQPQSSTTLSPMLSYAITDRGIEMQATFYANNGKPCNHNPTHLQETLIAMEDLFLQVGLHVNGKKMKAMTVVPTLAT